MLDRLDLGPKAKAWIAFFGAILGTAAMTALTLVDLPHPWDVAAWSVVGVLTVLGIPYGTYKVENKNRPKL